MTVRVVTAAQSAARDAAAIAAGIPSRELMERAGAAAAACVVSRFRDRLPGGVTVFAGPGNNGGDAWVVARHLAAHGTPVHVVEAGESHTEDARAARTLALAHVSLGPAPAPPGLVIDGLLGTGSRGAPTGAVADAVLSIADLRAAGAVVVALDLPTGLDASSGSAGGSVVAQLTVTFGTVKRGHLLARSRCGEIVVVDIGLGLHAELDDGAAHLVDAPWVMERIPSIPAEAHKGTRRRIVIAGGARGMAGAVVLAARAAARAGVGMVRLLVGDASLAAVQGAAVEATAATWPLSDGDLQSSVTNYAHAVLVGPGLGHGTESREFVEQLLRIWTGPTVLDADALNVFAGDTGALARLLNGRPAIITPHAAELARLLGTSVDDVMRQRFDAGRELCRTLRVAVLAKGVPTVLFAPDGAQLVTAAGTPALAAAGSGDLLGGIATTLLAQTGQPLVAAACAAWAHGRAAELANAGRPVRGITLDDVMTALRDVWRFEGVRCPSPELACLAPAGDAL